LELGLVDTLGGLDLAIDIAANKAKLERYRIESFPKKKEAFEALLEKFGEDLKYRMIGSEMEKLEPYYKAFAIMAKQKGIQARLPFEIIFE